MTPPPATSAAVAPAPRPRLGWGWWVALAAVGLGLGITLLLTLGLDPWLRRQLEQQVATASQGRYQLRVGELHTSLWERAVHLRDLRLRTVGGTGADTTRLPHLRLALQRLDITDIGLLALLRRQEVPVGRVALDSLHADLGGLPPAPADARPLHERLPVAGLRLGEVDLRHISGSYGPNPARPVVQLGESQLLLRDVWLSAAAAADSTRIGYVEALRGQVRGAVVRAPGHEARLVRLAYSSATRRLQLDSVLVHPLLPINHTKTPAVRVSLALPRLLLTGLDAARLARRRFRADTLRFTRPRLALTVPARKPPSLHELLRPYLAECRLQYLTVTGGNLRVAGLELAPAIADIQATATGVQVLPHAGRPLGMYYAQTWRVHTGRATATLNAPYYHLSWRGAEADTRAGRLRLRQVLVLPTLSVVALARRKGHQTAHVTARLPEVQLTGLNFPAAVNRGELRAATLVVQSPRVSTRSDGRFPANPNISSVTPEALGRVPFRFAVEELRLGQATLTMIYRAPRQAQPGTLQITRFGGRLRNLSNDPTRMSAARPLTGRAWGRVQDKCAATLFLRANLLDPAGRHTVSGEFGTTKLSILNSMTVPTRGLAFRSGTVERIRFQMQLDQQAARGTMWGRYHDLKLQLLNKQNRPGLLHRLQTSAVNGIFIRDNNPRRPGQPLKSGSMHSGRERRYSVFSLWRQGLVSGMLNSAGVPKPLAKRLSEAE